MASLIVFQKKLLRKYDPTVLTAAYYSTGRGECWDRRGVFCACIGDCFGFVVLLLLLVARQPCISLIIATLIIPLYTIPHISPSVATICVCVCVCVWYAVITALLAGAWFSRFD